jgi:2-C-methyl-D-erythritol 4-phosphate cytidylyltransferase/2-C-methyl-D-erythritol 4-phosphate cytidylyltransferase/2-C-methyl-D-erythritol 2,4-cyclodiphosphate synthase
MDKAAVIILAAGSSSRMGGKKKEFQKLSTGVSVLENSLRVFASIPSVETIVVAIPLGAENEAHDAITQDLLAALGSKIIFVTGGNTRCVSVFNALCALVSYKPCYVLIHDGARPWVSCALVEKIIAAVKRFDAVIPLLPVTDTPKQIANSKDKTINNKEQGAVFIKNHLKRANIGIAQTPQVFKFPEILYAHKKAAQVKNEEFTDDAEIWGRFCGTVAAIPGEIENKKITFPEDLN